jgi:hypothetical protein
MAATRRNKSEPVQTSTANIVTVKADVDKLLPLKYYEISYQGPGPPGIEGISQNRDMSLPT